MLLDAASFETVWRALRGSSTASNAIVSFVRFLERKLGGRFVFDADTLPYGRRELAETIPLIETLRHAGIVRSYAPVAMLPDEPRYHLWRAVCNNKSRDITGGISAKGARDALIPALAEALERFIWFEEYDYFVDPRIATSISLTAHARAIAPERFVGFSRQQREENERLRLHDSSEYLWIRGHSWTSDTATYVPAQTMVHVHAHPLYANRREHVIRTPITTGLATYPIRTVALLSGALEVIERDAYMIMWLNQLSLPRIDIEALRAGHTSLDVLIASCEKYRLRVHIVRMITDAPTYAICAIVEDTTNAPLRFTLGLKAHRDIRVAAEDAILEALRARQNVRARYKTKEIVLDKKPSEVVHMERIAYWGTSERARRLEFLVSGPVQTVPQEAWDADTPESHWNRIVTWARDRGYEVVSVALGVSKRNPLPWHIEMVVMPELQPMHQNERFPYLGGERLTSVPRAFGYEPRTVPFASEPHPFA